MKMRRVKSIVFLVICSIFLMCIVTLTLHIAGYDIVLVHSNDEIGTISDNGRFCLIEMSDPTERMLIFVIEDLKPERYESGFVYTTQDRLYNRRYINDYGWIEGTDDFYVNSTDTGMNLYRFDGSSWLLVGEY